MLLIALDILLILFNNMTNTLFKLTFEISTTHSGYRTHNKSSFFFLTELQYRKQTGYA